MHYYILNVIKGDTVMQVFIDYLSELNWLAVLVAAFVAFLSGALWYSKPLLGSQWQKAVGLSDKKIKEGSMTKVMTISLLTVVVSAVAMGLLIKVLVLTSFYQGALFGIMVAIGILGANKLMQTKFEQRPLIYWAISLGADIVAFSLIGGILAVWQ
jgi:hypothetical protein